ncbi:MAG: amidohydrolase [Proteobacteria bacterium]|nr:amidohydrolase [Pseudomonadota bacterium]
MWSIFLACAPPAEPPDLRIQAALEPGGPVREIAVRKGRIESIGDPVDGGDVVVADVVTPGLIDAHAHPGGLGRKLAELDLVGTVSIAEVAERVAGAEGTGWLSGRGWDQNDWEGHDGWPTASDLDHVDRPVALRRVDGHALWLNSAGLAAAGITADTASPDGGRIVRTSDGAPTGVLIDTAMGLVDLPAPDAAEKERRLRTALDEIVSTGLVGVHDMGVTDEGLALYESMADELPIRVWVFLDPEAEAVERLCETGPWGSGRLRVVGVKAYADGALGSRGAHLSAAYSDEPESTGLEINSTERLTELGTCLLGGGAQLAVHAIGDAGIHSVLDAFEASRVAVPDAGGVPLRVEHLQVVAPEDLARMKDLNAIASMQPTHATSDMPWAEARLGPERVEWSYAWRDVLQAGVPLTFGSDFPVEATSPSFGLWSATTRMDLDGQPEGGWRRDQVLRFGEAVEAFSSGTYTALGLSGGELEIGGRADLTLWSVEERHGKPFLTATWTLLDGEPAQTGQSSLGEPGVP